MARGVKASAKKNPPSFAAPAKGGKRGNMKAAVPVSAPSSDDDVSEDENFMSFDKEDNDSDVEDDAGVFDLKMKDSDDEDEEEGSEEEEESEEDSDDEDNYYDDDDMNEEERDLQALVDNLPLEMRTKIRSGQTGDDSEEDDDEEEDADELARWGKKKAYYSGDTADLEIGQEMEDAIDEEEAAKELYQQKVKRMKKKDFYDDLNQDEDEEDSEAEAAKEAQKKKKQSKDRVTKELEAIALGSAGDVQDNEVVLEKLAKDVSKMSKAQKLELIAENSPELLSIVSELRERVDELQSRITPVKELVQKLIASNTEMKVDDDLVDYLEVKQQLLLSYCVNVVFYLYMKSLGKSVRSHPVMRQLLRLRYCMEKMQGLDGKLKYQIDRLVKVAEAGQVSAELQTSLLKPNLVSLLNNDDNDNDSEEEQAAASSKKNSKKAKKQVESSEDEEEDSDDEDDEEEEEDYSSKYSNKKDKSSSSDNVYRAPKMTSVPYPNEREEERNDRKLAKQKQKLRDSELMAALNAEFGSAPEESGSAGFGDSNGDLKRLEEEAKERIKFEEDHFIRTTMSRKDKKDIKRRMREATRIDNFEDIGDFADLEEISKLSSGGDSDGKKKKGGLDASSNPFLDASSSKAMKRAAMEFGGNGGSKNMMDLLAAEFGGEEHTSSRKRRRAPEQDDDLGGGDDGNNIFDDFVSKKKDFLDKKKEHYTAEPRYGGYEESVEDGQKRAASYEIIKNRGLTPHRKKENRNGRVKKRMAFEKATIRRKGQVRDVIKGAAGSYGGEDTGIKAQVARSRKL